MAENENMSSKQLEDSAEPSVTSSPVTDTDAVETSTSAQSRHDLVKKIQTTVDRLMQQALRAFFCFAELV